MKTSIFSARMKTPLYILSVLCLSCIALYSCEEPENEGDPFFFIEGEPTGLSVDMNSNSASFTVRSNRPWQLVSQGDDSWTRAFPDEGEDDGIFKLFVEENNTFDDRTMNFAIVVDGEEQPVLFRVDQEANVPYITIEKSETGMTIPAASGSISISITANVNWNYSLSDDSWLEELDVIENEIAFFASKNKGDERTCTLTVTSVEFPDLKGELVITQSAGHILLYDDFSWLTYGSSVPYEWENAVRYDSWTADEKARWDVTPNQFSSNQPCTYGVYGFVKLGKTKYGSDIITPSLDIEGTVNLKVSFKSAVYISASGNVDDRILKVFALGAGTTSVSEFTIDNVPNSLAEDQAGIINDIWDPERAYSFTVTNATAATKIKFLAGDYQLEGVGQGKNRIFLDDIKIEIVD